MSIARVRSELVLASTNRGKLKELQALLAGLPVDVRGVHEVLAKPPHVVEDGDTFAANAAKKALTVAGLTHCMTLADDSGLEVDVLDGRPGVRSARFAYEGATDAENNAALVKALEAVGHHAAEGREKPFAARFRCVLALVDPFTNGGEPFLVDGTCEGSIPLTLSPRGAFGFGYDPLFVVDGMGGRTLAELSDDEKNAVSHRGRAMARLAPALEKILAARDETVRRIVR